MSVVCIGTHSLRVVKYAAFGQHRCLLRTPVVAQGTLIHPPAAAPSITMVKRARSKDEVATNQIVKLNVGGRKFHVGRQTLDAFGYMRARLNDGFPLELDDEGHVFVDRDPSIFEVQLAYPSRNDLTF